MLHAAVAVAGGVRSDRVTLQPITCFIIGPSKRRSRRMARAWGPHMGVLDANFIGLFSHSHAMPAKPETVGRLPAKLALNVTKSRVASRRVASTRKLCNILLNVSISVSDLAQTVAVSAKFRRNLACRVDSMGTEQDSNSNSYRQEQQQQQQEREQHRKESAERQQ